MDIKRLNGHEYALAYVGKDALFFENGTNALTGAAVVAAAPEGSVRTEDKGVGVEIVIWVLCRQPVLTDLADVAVFFIPGAACSGQKDIITIYFTSEHATYNTIDLRPHKLTVVK